MLHLLIQKMKSYYKTISAHLRTLVDVVQRNKKSDLQGLGPRPDSSPVEAESPPQAPEPLDATLLKAAARRSNPSYSPLGDSHALTNPAGPHTLSQSRDYIVYTPPGYNADEALPLVMVLHGCRQTHLDIRADTGFDAIADRERFIVVYPFVTRYVDVRNKNCWGWWLPLHIRSGSGEVEDLRSIIEQVQQKFTVDDSRIHITGLSSGAGMTVAALVAHGKLFASGASVAGLAYGESVRAVRINNFISVKYHSLRKTVASVKKQLDGKGKLAPLLIVQSHNDKTVEIKAAINLRNSWLELKRAKKERPEPVLGENQEIDWQYRQFPRGKGPTPVETLLVEEVKHGWIGGNEGKFSEPRGPNISEIIWLFFKRHPR